jgi:hypothetical protein
MANKAIEKDALAVTNFDVTDPPLDNVNDESLLEAMRGVIDTEVSMIEKAMTAHLTVKIDALLQQFQSAKTNALRAATLQIRNEINQLK